MDGKHLNSRITQDPAIMTGKPCIRDTRIPVDMLLRKLAAGETRQRLLRDYARLEDADLNAAIEFGKSDLA